LCEATLITPTSILKPDKRTVKLVAEARAHERKLIREATLLHVSNMRGEGTEDRVAGRLPREESHAREVVANHLASVHQLTRLDRPKLRQVAGAAHVAGDQVERVEADFSILQAGPQ